MDQLLFACIVFTAFNLFLIIYAFTLPLYPTSWRKKVNKKNNNDTTTGIAIIFTTLFCCVLWIIYFFFLIFHL
tara:strand:+ start:428 stop:646 length:219 start_codon:yes stop_codon:yes gene_type:complete